MTKAEITAEISRTTGVDKDSVGAVLEQIMSTVKDAIASGESIYLRGFGTFTAKERKEKTGRNISKGESVIIPAHKVPFFKPSKSFVDSLK